ncbi:hypothetical protein Q7P35_006691 [Cladosporium inversicolor]
MVATRRSLGGHPSPAAPPPPAAAAAPAAAAQLSRAQQAALKKLTIAGTDALKGDTKAAQAAKEAVQTYHYRGAVYAADANTPSSWIENQPKRYLKRSRASSSDVGEDGEGSIAVSEEREDEEDEAEVEEIRRPAKKKKSRHSMPHQGRNHKPVVSQTPTSSRGKARGIRGGRQSLPAKRKAAEIDDNNDNDNDSSMNEFDYAISGGPDERVCLPRTPSWLTESEPARRDRLSHRVNALPSTKSPIPNRRAMNDDIQRRKEGAARKNYQVQALGEDDIMSEKDLARVALVKLARKQRQLNEKMIEWRMAKDLLEAKKKEAELKAAMPEIVETAAPEQPNEQPAIDQTQSNKANKNEIDEQWEREQEQNRARNKSKPQHTEPEIQATRQFADPAIPYLSNATYHPFTKAGASRPSTPLSTIQTPLTGPNALPHSSKHGYTMPAPRPNPPATPTSDSKKQNQTNTSPPRHETDVDFTTLPPNAPLPTHSAGGDPMRWTIQRRMSVDQTTGEERAEYAIDIARLEGESKSAKTRRIKREKAVVESWGLVDGSAWVEVVGGGQS